MVNLYHSAFVENQSNLTKNSVKSSGGSIPNKLLYSSKTTPYNQSFRPIRQKGTHSMSNKINAGNPEVNTKTNILEITLPTELENAISTGWEHFDALCAGDGMIPSTVGILTGLPGSGKSTFAIQLADSITKTGNIALYNTCEESIYQVRRTAKRMELQNGFVPSYHH